MAEREKLIEVKDLQISFGKGRKKFVAVDHVNFDIYKGETFSLVGESGSGKTTIGRAITRINPTSAGEIYFKGKKINGKISKELDREVIKSCQMIFQDPMASLNERAKVDYIVSEGLLNFHMYKDEADREAKVQKALREVGLLPEFASRFPHEFSGGQRQRIGPARALIMEPSDADEFFPHPLHPYTKALLSAVPIPDPEIEKKKKLLIYDPTLHDYTISKPQWVEITEGHFVYGNEPELEKYRAEIEAINAAERA